MKHIVRHSIALLALMILTICTAPAAARVYSPRVVSADHPDTYSMRTFAEFPPWQKLTGDAKAWAIFRYLTDRRTGLYPMGAGAWEGTDAAYDFALVRDPVKMMNVYSLGYCDVMGPVMEGIWEEAGLGPARTVNLPGWGHVACEVSYGGSWHYLDLDVRAAFRRADGSLASLAEARRDATLWARPNDPRFFPLDPLARVQQIYGTTPIQHRTGVHMAGHTMDFALRRGETFTRWWRPQGGRWLHHASYNRPAPRQLIESEPRGPKCKHASFTQYAHGNGRLVYEPHLRAGSRDFADGAYDVHNVRLTADGLARDGAGEAWAVFEVRTPYVIVPLVGNLDDVADDREASIVTLDATAATAAISLDGGRSWQTVAAKDGQTALDLTPQVAGTYGYLLRLSLDPARDDALVRGLKIDTWVQLAPASLPGLSPGRNELELRTGDHYGLSTRVVEIRPDTTRPEEFSKYLQVAPLAYHPAGNNNRIKGEFVVRVPAPPHSRIAWFSAGGSFQTHQQQAAANTRNTMAYAAEKPEGFVEFYRAAVPTDNEHWHYNAQREVRLDQPAGVVFVRYVGDPAVNAIRIYAHVLDDDLGEAAPVTVTHRWTEAGVAKNFRAEVHSGGKYVIDVAGEPIDESIELAIPSDRPR